MVFDLHTHSNASDGTLDPIALIERAECNGVSHLAITDHDTTAGIQQLQRLLSANACQSSTVLIPGVELTALYHKQWVHVVGLWVDVESPVLVEFLAEQNAIRQERGGKIAEILEREGVTGAYEGARVIAGNASLSRPHFARYLVQAGYCKTEQQAFKRWLGTGKICDIKCAWPPLEKVVRTVRGAAGLAVLAHPDKYRLTQTKLRALLTAFKVAGGEGIELISGSQRSQKTQSLLALAEKFGLSCSTGSDFHSPLQAWCDVGSQAALPENAVPVWRHRL